jgi:hypothetical protein
LKLICTRKFKGPPPPATGGLPLADSLQRTLPLDDLLRWILRIYVHEENTLVMEMAGAEELQALTGNDQATFTNLFF